MKLMCANTVHHLRAQYLRVLFAELTRICNHMLNLGSHVMDVGAMTPNLWMFEIREDCLNFFERASGARMHSAWFRPGGVHQENVLLPTAEVPPRPIEVGMVRTSFPLSKTLICLVMSLATEIRESPMVSVALASS